MFFLFFQRCFAVFLPSKIPFNSIPYLFIESQYLSMYSTRPAYVLSFQYMDDFRASIAFSLASIELDLAILLSFVSTSSFIPLQPFTDFDNHLSQACSRWKSHMNTVHSKEEKLIDFNTIPYDLLHTLWLLRESFFNCSRL